MTPMPTRRVEAGCRDAGRSALGRSVWSVTALLAAVTCAAVLRAQDPPAEPPTGERTSEGRARWIVDPSEAADLWFHTLAVAGANEDGLLPLYSRDYAERVRARKESLDVYPTMLDGASRRIRRTVEHDDRLAFVHVLPLYFDGASVGDMLAALDAVARQRDGDRVLSVPNVRYGTEVVAEVFADSRSREFLGDLVRVMRDEYEAFFRAFYQSEVMQPDSGTAGRGSLWVDQLTRDLADFFARMGLRGGTIVPSPALGAEGRVVQFDPFGPDGRVVAAGRPLEGLGRGAAVNGVLKELCYAVVERAEIVGREVDGREERALRTRAAVRCGAIVLQFYAPARLVGYRRQFVTAAAPETLHPASAAAFDSIFPLDPGQLAGLKAVIRGR